MQAVAPEGMMELDLAKDVWSDMVIAIPTFRRNERLENVLRSIEDQSVFPAMVLVIDNNPEGDAKAVVDDYESPAGIVIEYLRMGSNAGPAGAFAAALSYLGTHPGRPEWMSCRDDDLPFDDTDRIAQLHTLAKNAPPSVAGVGIWGTHHVQRESIPEYGPIPVDIIPGGGEATYKISTLAKAGLNFDEKLFFGFEEMDMGLRIRRAGLQLLAGELKHANFVTGERRTSDWRTYFGERNWLIIAREYGPYHKFLYFALRALASSAKKLVRGGQRSTATARFLGAIDGIRGAKPRPSYIPQ